MHKWGGYWTDNTLTKCSPLPLLFLLPCVEKGRPKMRECSQNLDLQAEECWTLSKAKTSGIWGTSHE